MKQSSEKGRGAKGAGAAAADGASALGATGLGAVGLGSVGGGSGAGATGPTAEQIRLRAYEIYLRRKGAGGNPESDWLQAERELSEEISGRSAAPASASGRAAVGGAGDVSPEGAAPSPKPAARRAKKSG